MNSIKVFDRFFTKKCIVLILMALSINFFTLGQEKEYFKEGTIEEQIDYVIEKSSTWENFKVVAKGWMTNLKKNTLDSLNAAKNDIYIQKKIVIEKEAEITNLREILQETQEKLDIAQKEKDTITFLGKNITKNIFITTVIIIFITLIALMIIIFGLYNRNNKNIRKTLDEFEAVNKEYENYRQESRKKHEQLVIQHHKEIQRLRGL